MSKRTVPLVGAWLTLVALFAMPLPVPSGRAAPQDQLRQPTSTTAGANSAAPMTLGMNLAGVVDWSREWAFVDVFKHARDWIPQNPGGAGPWDTGKPIKTNAAGWPLLAEGQAAATLLCRDTGGHYPAGQYVCTYQGKGDLSFGFDAKVVRREVGRITLDVAKATDGGILLRIDRSDAADPVRDIHVWMPGFENAKSAFHPLFVARLKPFRVLRFMDWASTNNHPAEKWSERTRPDSIRQAGAKGVAIEHMIDLCNELGADPWFCMPHLADDEYVREFAKLVRGQLRREAKIYVEWSNEAWNGIFAQARWVQSQAKERKVEWTAVIAEEARRDWNLWREAFGDDAARVVRVAAGQHVNPWVCESIAGHLAGDFDALSCAGYFYPRDQDLSKFTDKTTAKQVLESALVNIDETGIPMLQRHAQLAEKWSKKTARRIPLVLYEAGQHITVFGAEKPYAQAFLEAQTQPLMKTCYERLLAGCRREGVELVVAFSYVGGQSKWGSWGHLRHQDENERDAPKFQALLEAAGGTSP